MISVLAGMLALFLWTGPAVAGEFFETNGVAMAPGSTGSPP